MILRLSIMWCSNLNFKCHCKFVNEIQDSTWIKNTAQKMKFSIKYSVNVTISAVPCGFGHIY